MCGYCEELNYIHDTLAPNGGFRAAILESGREVGIDRYVGESCMTLCVNYKTPDGNGMMGEYIPINFCPMCGRDLRGDD